MLLAGAVVLTIALLVLAQAKPTATRTADQCLESGGVPAAQVVLIDATESYTADEAGKLAYALQRQAEALEIEGKLSIDALQPDGKGKTLRSLFSRCKPRDGSKASALTENGRLLGLYYSKTFTRPLQEVLDSMTALGSADTSPILEALYALAMTFESIDGPKRLLIVSDLLEYSKLMNMYRSYNWDKAKNIAKVKAMQDRLHGVDVMILLRLHKRAGVFQGMRHEAFWRSYFAHAGVSRVRIMPL